MLIQIVFYLMVAYCVINTFNNACRDVPKYDKRMEEYNKKLYKEKDEYTMPKYSYEYIRKVNRDKKIDKLNSS